MVFLGGSSYPKVRLVIRFSKAQEEGAVSNETALSTTGAQSQKVPFSGADFSGADYSPGG
jgi:uncharacterized protein YjbI with pentapeptide repeats